MKKRSALKTIILGGAAIQTSSVWLKPTINTILLPAHAQTSSLLTIPGFIENTDADDFAEDTYYQIDDRVRAGARLIEVSSQKNTNTILFSRFGFFSSGAETSTQNFFIIRVGDESVIHSIDFSSDDSSPTPTPSIVFSGVPASVSIMVIALSGAIWNISYNVTQTGAEEFTVSDIILTPA